MSENLSEMARIACLWARIFWTFFVLAQWRALPGPWWCKLLQFVILQLIPGQFDEALYLAALWLVRRLVAVVRTRMAARA